MPVIPVSPDNPLALFAAIQRLCKDPTSWEASAEAEKAMRGAAAISYFRHEAGDEFTISREDLDLIAVGQPGRIPLPVKVRDWVYGLATAGHVLVYTLRLAKHIPRLASAATAMRILEWLYSTPAYKCPASPTSIKNAWRTYRPIAHFVGATDFMFEEYQSLGAIFPMSLDMADENARYIRTDQDMASKVLADAEQIGARLEHAQAVTLPRYFAFAETLRRAGTAQFATGQDVHGHSLLDPETSWRLPEGLALPHVQLDLTPLSEAEIKAAGVK